MDGLLVGLPVGTAAMVLCGGAAVHIGMPHIRKCLENRAGGGQQMPSSATASRIRPPVRNDTRVDKSDSAGSALALRTIRRDGSPRTVSGTPSSPSRDHALPSPRVAPTTPRCTTPPPYPFQSSRRVPSPPPYALFERGVQSSSHSVGSEDIEAPITTQPTA